MQNLQNFLEKQKKSKKKGSGNAIAEIHHVLMKQYGWIPYEEFKRLPIVTMFNLMDEIKREAEEYNKVMSKSKGKKGMRR